MPSVCGASTVIVSAVVVGALITAPSPIVPGTPPIQLPALLQLPLTAAAQVGTVTVTIVKVVVLKRI